MHLSRAALILALGLAVGASGCKSWTPSGPSLPTPELPKVKMPSMPSMPKLSSLPGASYFTGDKKEETKDVKLPGSTSKPTPTASQVSSAQRYKTNPAASDSTKSWTDLASKTPATGAGTTSPGNPLRASATPTSKPYGPKSVA